jgi:hypothetical protein
MLPKIFVRRVEVGANQSLVVDASFSKGKALIFERSLGSKKNLSSDS